MVSRMWLFFVSLYIFVYFSYPNKEQLSCEYKLSLFTVRTLDWLGNFHTLGQNQQIDDS